jgi:hypothetical protein
MARFRTIAKAQDMSMSQLMRRLARAEILRFEKQAAAFLGGSNIPSKMPEGSLPAQARLRRAAAPRILCR